MCGIAGTYQQAEGKLITSVMVERLAHRGPDASAVLESVNPRASVVLGHLRLSIIDLSSAADGPFTKNGLTITYNGELYNYRQLRAELERSGVRFATSSDTEVVLEAWRAWGPDGLRRFRGMYAFAIHDAATDELALARDPLGIKPLFVMRRGAGIVFASELKAIVTAVGQELSIDPLGLAASALYYWLPEQVSAGARGRQAPGWVVDRLPTRRHEREWHLLGPGRGIGTGGARCTVRPPRGRRGVRRGAPGRRTCPWRRSSAADSTRASSRPSHTTTFRRSRPTRSRSAAWTSDWRPCRTTPGTPASWPSTSGSGCTRSRSRPTWWTCCRGWSTSSTSRSAIPPRSTRCSCARAHVRPASRCCSPGWAPTSCSVGTASSWPACSPCATSECRGRLDGPSRAWRTGCQ